MTDTLNAALDYHHRGLPITLCAGKEPICKAWQLKTWTAKKIKKEFELDPSLNVGCIWGPTSKMIDMEADSREAEHSLLELFNGDVPVTATFRSTRGPHRLFAWHSDLEATGKGKLYHGKLEIHLGAGGKGAQSLLPPSTTDDFTRGWLVTLDDCDPAPLPKAVVRRLLLANQRVVDPPVNTINTETQEILCKQGVPNSIRGTLLRTIPSEPGHRHRAIFNLVRALKSTEALAGAELDALKPIMREWHRRALPTIGTKDFDESWADFAYAWGAVVYPGGTGPVRVLFQQAMARPLPPEAFRYSSQPIRALVALCAELQREAGTDPFFLSCRVAAELLEVSHVQANKWLRLLTTEGVLRVATPGTRHKATEFFYLGGVEK